MMSPDTYDVLNLALKRMEAAVQDVREMLLHPNCHNCAICRRDEANRKVGL
ncbi:MAG: hypothetical protein IPI85_16270 [Dehalococcoidia bacterium]|nr:hypothetical protein [Dehalococcoidia bacterium]